MSVSDLLQQFVKIAQERPDALAIWQEKRQLSFGEVLTACRTWKQRLTETEIGRCPVIIQIPEASELLPCLYGVWSHGGIAVIPDPTTSAKEIHALGRRLQAAAVISREDVEALPDPRRLDHSDLIVGKLTSGSTGAPQIYYFTASQMAADAHQICSTMGIGQDDRNFAVLPLGHSYALGNVVMPFFTQGTSIAQGSSYLPGVISNEVRASEATILPATPALLKGLARADVETLWPLRLVISAGAPLPPKLAQTFADRFGLRIHNFYGSSETGGIAYDRSGEASLTGRSIGTPLDGVTVEPTKTGRLCVSSASVFTFQNENTNASLGSFIVADQGHLDASGGLVLTGRSAELLKVGARRIAPEEICAVFRQHPSIGEAFLCVETSDARSDELVAAFEVSTNVTPQELRQLAQHELVPWKRPRHLLVFEAFPRTLRGKLDRPKLLEMIRQRLWQ